MDWEVKGSDPLVFTIAGGSMMRFGKTVIGLYVAGMLLVTAASATSALAEPSGPVESPADMAVLELLRAEVLDTVSLDRPVHFTTPQATDTVAQAGTYRVEIGAPSQMKLVAVKHNTAMVVEALNITHRPTLPNRSPCTSGTTRSFPTWSCYCPEARDSKRSAPTIAAARVDFAAFSSR